MKTVKFATYIVLFFLTANAVLAQEDQKLEPYSQNIPGSAVSIEMVPIPGGEFTMGSPKSEANRKDDEGPQHKVQLDPFWMGKYEITWAQYEEFLDKTKIGQAIADASENERKTTADAITRPSPPYEDPSFNMGRTSELPAVSMTQYAALMFCKWLSTITGEFYRLPTEAEWEYACRAGANTAYSFGDDVKQLGEYGVFYENSDGTYKKVGSKKPNEWGLYDMHGNVAEWTLDQYFADFYAKSGKTVSNPWAMPVQLDPRSVRGGSFDDDPDLLRCAARVPSDPDKWKRRDPQIPKSFWWNTDSPFVGFRIVKPAKKMTPEEIAEFWAKTLDE